MFSLKDQQKSKMSLYYLVFPCTTNESNLLAVLAIFSGSGDLDLMFQTNNNVSYFLCTLGASICI